MILVQPAHAAGDPMDKVKAFARPWIVKFFGDEKANAWLGEDESEIHLPALPKLTSNAAAVTDSSEIKDVVVTFTKEESNRYDINFIREIYEATRQIRADDNDINKWMNVLTQGGSREGVYRALVLDQTYAGLENLDEKSNDSVASYADEFLGTYINVTIGKEKLANANFYSVKRIVAEKALEMFDQLRATNQSELYDWYAVLSSELATKFGSEWQNDLRKDQSKTRHRRWAQSLPEQYIKSELLIKLHGAFNSLAGKVR
jgi:hypothetical protein